MLKDLEVIKKVHNFAAAITIQNHNNMIKFKEYKTREELVASFKQMLKMREEYETHVRQKYDEMKAAGLI